MNKVRTLSDIKYTNDVAKREWHGNFSFSESNMHPVLVQD